MPAGRPSSYDPEIAADICSAISVGTKGLRELCDSEERFPDVKTFYRWMIHNEELRQLYAQAKESQLQIIADEILPIAEEEPIMTITFGENGVKTCVDNAGIQRNRLRIDSRKWLLSKLAPKKYGDKITHSGDEDSPLQVVVKRVGSK